MTTYRLDDQGIAVVQEVLLFSRNVQADSGVHPASCLMDTRGLRPWVKWPIVKLRAQFHPMSRLRMCVAISLPSTCLHGMHRNFNFAFFYKKAYTMLWQTKEQWWYIHIPQITGIVTDRTKNNNSSNVTKQACLLPLQDKQNCLIQHICSFTWNTSVSKNTRICLPVQAESLSLPWHPNVPSAPVSPILKGYQVLFPQRSPATTWNWPHISSW